MHAHTQTHTCGCSCSHTHKHKHKIKEREAEPRGCLELFPNQRHWGEQERPSVSTVGTLSGLQTNTRTHLLMHTHKETHTSTSTNRLFFWRTHLKPYDIWGRLWSNRRLADVTHAHSYTWNSLYIPVWNIQICITHSLWTEKKSLYFQILYFHEHKFCY